MSTLVLSLILFASTQALINSKKDYYWRDYDGHIPEDALPGGRDRDYKNIYIGQAYIKDEGIAIVQIDPDRSEVYGEMQGTQVLDDNIKILCGPPENFYWMDTNFTQLHTELKTKQLVVGGHEDGWGDYFVGRIGCNDGYCIGKVLEHGGGGMSVFYAVDRDKNQLKSNSYEVLVNKQIPPKPKDGSGSESSLSLTLPHIFSCVLCVLFSIII
ncbi:uncharacterized protein LOC135123936 [Zophobas morio]|uniref:uncharacterized protein LOC135123936 n=1 Tax=Zophobas morio TaxID=2755281 RepID=UPI003083B0AF